MSKSKTQTHPSSVRIAINAMKDVRPRFADAEANYQQHKFRIYEMLSEMFLAYAVIKQAEHYQREVFTKEYEAIATNSAFPSTSATSLELKVVRFCIVDADLSQFRLERQKKYARVLKKAYEVKIQDAENVAERFVDYIIESGGIDELVRSNSSKKNQSENVEAARTKYCSVLRVKGVQLAPSFANQITKTKNIDDDFVVALVRRSDKKIVAITESTSSVKSALNALGEQLNMKDEKAASTAARKDAAARKKAATTTFSLDDVINNAVSQKEAVAA